MKHFNCGAVVPNCGAVFAAATESELLDQVARHAKVDHDLDPSSAELVDQVRRHIEDRP